MLGINVVSHRKSPGFEVRAVVSLGRPTNEMESRKQKAKIEELRNKLEQTVPGSFKPKYNLASDELVITIKADDMSHANSIQNKMHEFIKSAAKTLGIH